MEDRRIIRCCTCSITPIPCKGIINRIGRCIGKLNCKWRGSEELLVGIEIGKSNTDLEYLSSIENQIRRVLFFDKPKLLEIEVQQGDSPKIIKITEEHKKPEELAKFFLTNKLPLGSKIMIEPRPQGNYKITIKSK